MIIVKRINGKVVNLYSQETFYEIVLSLTLSIKSKVQAMTAMSKAGIAVIGAATFTAQDNVTVKKGARIQFTNHYPHDTASFTTTRKHYMERLKIVATDGEGNSIAIFYNTGQLSAQSKYIEVKISDTV